MCKKLTYLISFLLVLGLVLTSAAKAADPDLVGYWKFDETSGTTAQDATGNGNDGTLNGDPQWVAGKLGGALEFDGDGDYVDCGDNPIFNITDQITVACWIKVSQFTIGWQAIFTMGDDSWRLQRQTTTDNLCWACTGVTGTPGDWWLSGSVNVNDGEWHHTAGVYDGSKYYLYVDGNLDASKDTSGTMSISSYPVYIGANAQQGGREFEGLIDDVRIYSRALRDVEILGVMAGGGAEYPLASGPVPADGALLEDTWVNLSWRAGDYALSHDVYLGENFDDVAAGAEGAFQGNQAVTNLIIGFPGFPYPDGLVPGTTYYWRIDEVNDTEPNSPWKGDVWSFWIPPYTAYDSNPADGVKFVDPDAELNWTAGFGAKLHTVYFGENFDDVNNAVVGLPQSETTYTPGALELEKVYYWRIDEFDGVNTYKGDVWSFSTIPVIPITDPSLVGWWKLDENMGTTAVDWSGHSHHGTLINGPQWVPGYDGDALEFDGIDDYVNLPYVTDPTVYTICAWVRPADTSPANIIVRTSPSGPTVHWSHQLRINSSGTFEHYVWDGTACTVMGTTTVRADTWYHVVGIATNNGQVWLYVNGWAEGASASVGTMWADGDRFIVGSNSGGGMGQFDGLIDDVRIYNKALTIEEIKLAMRGDPLLAGIPNPTNGSTTYIRETTPLSWSPGDNASQHDVYFGTDRDAVADADASDTTGIYRGRQSVTIYTPPEVEWGGGPYYWRIDEYNTDATISKGNVWSFTVADFIEIDDIEDYNDYPPYEIFSTWIDGWEVPTNGSLAGHAEPPFAETGNVHGGRQSMPVYYENSFKYSEITMTLTQRDWTEEGVGVLSLWFYGDAANAAERIYVNLNGIATVYHNDPSAALIEEWTEWRIDLQEFAAQGVNLANVNTISIGFGDKNNLGPGGSGMVLFDDICLYRLAEPEPQP